MMHRNTILYIMVCPLLLFHCIGGMVNPLAEKAAQDILSLRASIERHDEQLFHATMEKIRSMDIPGIDQDNVSSLYNPVVIPEQQITALHYAAQHGFSDGVENIMQYPQKVDIHITDTTGNTPLHHAVYTGRVDIVRQLLRYGADPELKNQNNVSAVDIAHRYKDQFPQMHTIYTILTTSVQDLLEHTYNNVAFLHRTINT